ncbi:hypothetical protein Tco_1153575 [Tanacetum coccineum]
MFVVMFMVLPSLQINFKKFAATDSDMRWEEIKADTVEKRRKYPLYVTEFYLECMNLWRREEMLAMVWLITGASLPTPYAERLALPQIGDIVCATKRAWYRSRSVDTSA